MLIFLNSHFIISYNKLLNSVSFSGLHERSTATSTRLLSHIQSKKENLKLPGLLAAPPCSYLTLFTLFLCSRVTDVQRFFYKYCFTNCVFIPQFFQEWASERDNARSRRKNDLKFDGKVRIPVFTGDVLPRVVRQVAHVFQDSAYTCGKTYPKISEFYFRAIERWHGRRTEIFITS